MECTFSYCNNLTSVVLPSSLTFIGYDAFYNCYKLLEVYNKSSLDITAGASDYGYVGYYAQNVYTPTNGQSKLSTDENGYITYTAGDLISLISYAGTETELTLPSNITEINVYAFYGRSDLTSLTIGADVTAIGDYAFTGCKNLTSIIFKGTTEEWDAIIKSWGWNYSARISEVVCSNGTVTL